MLLCVDPGLRGCGCALFTGGKLQWAGYVTNLFKTGRGPSVQASMAREVWKHAGDSSLIVEFPRIYPGMPKTDLNDLLDLAGVCGALAAFAPSTILHVFPSEWKGQVPKLVMNDRVLKSLTTDERMRIVKVGAKDHNTLDAVGIGLYHFGRINRRHS